MKGWIKILKKKEEISSLNAIQEISGALSVVIAEGAYNPRCLGNSAQIDEAVSLVIECFQSMKLPQLKSNSKIILIFDNINLAQTTVCLKNILSINPNESVNSFIEANGL